MLRLPALPWFVCLLVALAPALASARLPSLPALAARYGDALVVVYTAAGDRAGVGFFVASRGVFVTTIAGARPGDEVVVELASGERRRGAVLAVDASSPLALVEIVKLPKDTSFPSLGLQDGARAGRGDAAWLVGMDVDATGNAAPMLGGLRRVDAAGTWHVDLPCGPGAPLLDGRGRVVAVAIARAGRTAALGLPVARVRALVAAVAAPVAGAASPRTTNAREEP